MWNIFFYPFPLSLAESLDPQSLADGRRLDPGFSTTFASFQDLAGESHPLTSEATGRTETQTFNIPSSVSCLPVDMLLSLFLHYSGTSLIFFPAEPLWSLLISICMCSIAIFEVSMGIAFYTLK